MGDVTAALLLDLFQEGEDAVGCQILDGESVDRLVGSASGEGQKETQGIAVTALRVPGEVALPDEVLQQAVRVVKNGTSPWGE